MNVLTKLGATAGALVAVGAVLSYLASFLAWSADIRRLDRQQLETAVEVYSATRRSLLVIEPPAGTTAHKAWREELEDARNKLRRAQDRKIELSR